MSCDIRLMRLTGAKKSLSLSFGPPRLTGSPVNVRARVILLYLITTQKIWLKQQSLDKEWTRQPAESKKLVS
jgi:hypothetical protein